ncbi:dihydrofolate reductase [Sediminibacterium sp.]|uniref:dihydrofolate reductase n=1 Tax=Sediminibacterium sp. TaxID=1917865 RepID=UPI003F6A4BD3
MILSIIVAASENNAIGLNNQLLWRLPNDLKLFKQTTWAMPVIMGRKTFESLAGKPLNGRLNIVVTRQADWNAEGVEKAGSLEEAISIAASNHYKESFILGGGELYAASLPIAHTIYLTRVEAELDGDTFFPAIEVGEWKMIMDEAHAADEKHAYPYRFQKWIKNS